ncbi:MAG: hypothetical protein HYW86_04345 [Candidatus Roizmanbacteria bacterium]|nr:MAG: hypothetical protein HYW86_04345 [Candidatus Roizmanbacteria bacterium]
MNLLLHESIHLAFTFLSIFVVWKKYKNFWVTLSAAFIGGILIDLDHIIDYVLAFGLTFNLNFFLEGYQFLKTDKLFLFFHAYEYAFILGILFWFIKKNIKLKAFILALAISMFLHLIFDSYTNKIYVRSYFILERLNQNFDLKKLVYPDHYIKHEKQKKLIFPKD